MKLLRKIKLFFVPEYIIVMPKYTGKYADKPFNLGDLHCHVHNNIDYDKAVKLGMKYNVYASHFVDACIEAGLVHQYSNVYFPAVDLAKLIHDYTMVKVKH